MIYIAFHHKGTNHMPNFSFILTDKPYVVTKDFYEKFHWVFKNNQETETLKGFDKCLTFNSQSPLTVDGETVNFKEYVGVAYADNDTVAAGINFVVYTFPNDITTININYIFTMPDYQKQNLMNHFFNYIYSYFKSKYTYIFVEQNTKGDKDHVITAEIRRKIWRKLGFKRLMFNYYQPALKGNTQGTFLELHLLDYPRISKKILIKHLTAYFTTSVFTDLKEQSRAEMRANVLVNDIRGDFIETK